MEKVLNNALDKCFDKYAADVDTTLECKSGAMELERCMLREIFSNCPKDHWTDKPDCEDIKAKLTKCPKMHVLPMNPTGE